MKFKYAQLKKEAAQFAELQAKYRKTTEEVEKRKHSLSDDTARLKAAREEKKRLTNILQSLQKDNSRRAAPILSAIPSITRTEPPVSKSARMLPPCVKRKSSMDNPLGFMDQSTSKIATSTPIIHIKNNRRDYMNKMFGAGFDNPSPIPRL